MSKSTCKTPSEYIAAEKSGCQKPETSLTNLSACLDRTPKNLTVEFIQLSRQAMNLTGQRYGQLVVLGPVGKAKSGSIVWLCQCDCGEQVEVKAQRIRHDGVSSCGCHYAEQGRRKPVRHGMSDTSIYNTWIQLSVRCHSAESSNYENYGARGVSVCDEWRNSFEAFLDHVSQLPNYGAEGVTLDRIDNGGNYEPGNVRWATQKEQMRNTRRNRLLTHNGKTQCLAAWAEELGIRKNLIEVRLFRGWDAELALTATTKEEKRAHIRRNNHLLTCNGKTQSLAAWSDETGLSSNTIFERLKRGWDTDRALNTPLQQQRGER